MSTGAWPTCIRGLRRSIANPLLPLCPPPSHKYGCPLTSRGLYRGRAAWVACSSWRVSTCILNHLTSYPSVPPPHRWPFSSHLQGTVQGRGCLGGVQQPASQHLHLLCILNHLTSCPCALPFIAPTLCSPPRDCTGAGQSGWHAAAGGTAPAPPLHPQPPDFIPLCPSPHPTNPMLTSRGLYRGRAVWVACRS